MARIILDPVDIFLAKFGEFNSKEDDNDPKATQEMYQLLNKLKVMAEVLLYDWKDKEGLSKGVSDCIKSHHDWSMQIFEDWYEFPSGDSGDDFVVVFTSAPVNYSEAEKIADLYYNQGAFLPEIPKEEKKPKKPKPWMFEVISHDQGSNPATKDYFISEENLIENLENADWSKYFIDAIFNSEDEDVKEKYDEHMHDLYHTD